MYRVNVIQEHMQYNTHCHDLLATKTYESATDAYYMTTILERFFIHNATIKVECIEIYCKKKDR